MEQDDPGVEVDDIPSGFYTSMSVRFPWVETDDVFRVLTCGLVQGARSGGPCCVGQSRPITSNVAP